VGGLNDYTPKDIPPTNRCALQPPSAVPMLERDGGHLAAQCPEQAASMQPLRHRNLIEVEEYLRGEQYSDVRHEYIDGQVFAMVGASDRHGIIAGNLHTFLNRNLPDRCQVFIADMKVRLRAAEQEIFYYPDVLVSCDPADRETYYRNRPCLVAEVLSAATERVDRFEKRLAYCALPSLQEYLLITQDYRQVEIYRRAQGWGPELYTEGDIRLASLDLTLGFDELYRRVG